MSLDHGPLAWIDAELESLERAGLRRRLTVRTSAQRARVVLNGQDLVNFGCNDYLGLAADERLAAAAREAMARDGWGSGASPLVSGRSDAHAELERQLALFEGTEAALVFPSGFAANAGVIPALVNTEDAIFADARNHASLIDGCRQSKAKRFVFPHADCGALEEMLRGSGRYRRRLIVTDTLFSMDGDAAPLVRLAELAERYQCMLMVDEAHATGVFGAKGRGVVEHLAAECPGLEELVHVRVGTLSKALGSAGGFVCGRQSLIEWLANSARSYVFSTAPPAANCAAALAALEVVRREPARRHAVLQRAAAVRARLRELGWTVRQAERERRAASAPQGVDTSDLRQAAAADTSRCVQSQIIPLLIGDPERTMRLAQQLCEAGFFVPGIRPPSVPTGQSLLRISLCYHHHQELIDALLDQLGRLRTGK